MNPLSFSLSLLIFISLDITFAGTLSHREFMSSFLVFEHKPAHCAMSKLIPADRLQTFSIWHCKLAVCNCILSAVSHLLLYGFLSLSLCLSLCNILRLPAAPRELVKRLLHRREPARRLPALQPGRRCRRPSLLVPIDRAQPQRDGDTHCSRCCFCASY